MNISRNESKILYISFPRNGMERYYRKTRKGGKRGRDGKTIPRYLTGPPLFRFFNSRF